MSSRKYDLIVYGVTGYVGLLTLEWICKQSHNIRLAIAGRSPSKLETIVQKFPNKNLDVVFASSEDEASLRKMAKLAKVIISTVGPYQLYGTLLYKVCAEEGTHYLDLTGEPVWSAKMIKDYEQTAKKSGASKQICQSNRFYVECGAVMLSSSGFDSMPGDLNANLAIQALRQQVPDAQVGIVEAAYTVKGGVSNGTIASLEGFLDLDMQTKRSVAVNPYMLSPLRGQARRKQRPATTLLDGSKGALWVMAAVNERNVYRTWGLLEEGEVKDDETLKPYGKDFVYEEHMAAKSTLQAWAISSALATVFLILSFKWLRSLARKVLVNETEETRENGHFKIVTTAYTTDRKHSATSILKATGGDPGYKATSIMLAECALALILDWDRLPGKKGGTLTDVVAIGPTVLCERLVATGHFFFEQKNSSKSGSQSNTVSAKL